VTIALVRENIGMPRGDGFSIRRHNLGGSRGIVFHRLGRRQRSPSDAGEGRPHYRPGVRHITNSQIPAERELDRQIRRAELQGMLATHI
jgi:hypothetical protein